LIIHYFFNRKAYLDGSVAEPKVNWGAVLGVIAGAVVANLVKWGIPAINGMAVAAVIYVAGNLICRKCAK
jgi:cytosine permease